MGIWWAVRLAAQDLRRIAVGSLLRRGAVGRWPRWPEL